MKTVKKIGAAKENNTNKKNIFVTNGIFQVYKKRASWKLGYWFIGIGSILPLFSYSPEVSSDTPPDKPYLSAFAPKLPGKDTFLYNSFPADSSRMYYTIQLCTFDYPLEDPIIQNNPVIHLIRIGDLYRYIYAYFTTLDQARRELVAIQRWFPRACIREYRKGKLGQVIDMKINY